MDQSVFDAASFVAFNLEKGVINSPFQEGLALVPLEVLAALEPSEAIVKVARDFGKTHGQDLKKKKESGAFGENFEILSEHLSGTMATLGLGRLSLEIHGDSLLFRLKSDHAKDGCNAIISGFLGGYLEAITANPFEVLLVQDSGEADDAKLLWAGNPQAAEELRHLQEGGMEPLLALEELAGRSAS